MHLKKVEIQGFKSFPDKIEIEFNKGITAIVGPNGSGKSNIADAIRWVLGEQSVKTLRGSKMEDVIFAGTNTRKPLGFAEVTIVFDNRDGFIPIDYQEVAITRRMFRSGESEYYLNKNACRLKDIRELFMDTGIGKDGYSIIGQGRVDEILSSRPEDRRNIFEEAAGIVKYKTKKIEAERKLEKTDSNLVRIRDIIIELKSQSEKLKDQSENASKFLQLSDQLKELEVNILIRKIHEIERKIEKGKNEKESLQIKIDSILAEQGKIEGKLNSIKAKIKDLDLSIDQVQEEKAETLDTLNEYKNNLNVLEEKEKFYLKDIERLTREIEDLNNKLIELENEKNLLLVDNENVEKELHSLRVDFTQKNSNLERINVKIAESEKIIEKEKDKIIDYYNLITDKKSNLNSILSFKDNINKRIKQIEGEIHNITEEIKDAEALLIEIQKLESEKKEELVNINKGLANLKLKEKDYKDSLDKLYKTINQNKIKLQSLISNFNLLKNMEEDYEGYFKSVKNLLLASKRDESLRKRLVGVVADLLKVEEKYIKAIDVGLGGSLQNIVTKDEEDAKYLIQYLRDNKLGRVTFLPISTIKGKPIYISPVDRERYHILGLGSELISFDRVYKDIFEYLLGRTIVVENIDYATQVAKKFNYSYRVVTLEGDIINIGGSMTGGSLPQLSGSLLNRKYRMESIKKEINHITEILDKLEEEKINLKSSIDSNEKEIKTLEAKLQDINISIIRLENERNKYSTELNRGNEAITKYKDEIKKLNMELMDIEKKEEDLNRQLTLLNDENSSLKEKIDELMLEFEEGKAIREKAMKEVTDTKIQINSLENRLANNKEKLEKIEGELKNTTAQISLKENEIKEKKKEIDIISKDILSLEGDIDKLSILEKEQENIFHALRDEKDKYMEEFYLEQSRFKETNERLTGIEKQKNNWELKEAKLSVQLDNIYSKLEEEYELEYDEAIKLLVEIEDLDKAHEEVKRLKGEIKKLGSVNLSSIDEYRAVNERLEFMEKQEKDLLSAIDDLKKVIKDMESKMEKQFLSYFHTINENFNKVFSILFDGGKASLSLEDEKNILTCGIEINAMPPGKKLQNLNLLSGGEKSLTAVALLFAILQTKSTPFCILDEIDAALDDANINRYTSYLKSFSNKIQFIMITHRKKTMEIADVLYGVTMEEEGVSKMVSVKLSDPLEEIAS
ncbi:MAG: chromosome segregation protein SMC [Tissierellia bacterium]|nr:chromosome segregation protein SMC [Tissierellia bacterium]